MVHKWHWVLLAARRPTTEKLVARDGKLVTITLQVLGQDHQPIRGATAAIEPGAADAAAAAAGSVALMSSAGSSSAGSKPGLQEKQACSYLPPLMPLPACSCPAASLLPVCLPAARLPPYCLFASSLQSGEAANGTQFMITRAPEPSLDQTNLIVGVSTAPVLQLLLLYRSYCACTAACTRSPSAGNGLLPRCLRLAVPLIASAACLLSWSCTACGLSCPQNVCAPCRGLLSGALPVVPRPVLARHLGRPPLTEP